MSVELSIIIVNWNGIKFLPNCLKSIAENPPSVSYEIIVVDNYSGDGSQEWLASDDVKDLFPNGYFSLIKSEENLGFGNANNLAMSAAQAPIFLLLNPDTVVAAGAIDQLFATIKSDDRIGLVAPRLLSPDLTVHTSVWPFPNSASRILADGLGIYRLIPKKIRETWLLGRHWGHDQRRAVPFVSGAAMMLRRAVTLETGGFDPDIHMYGEDADLCARIHRHGWLILFEPAADVFHLGGQSSAQRWDSGETHILEEKGNIRVQQKYQSSAAWRRLAAARVLVLGLMISKRYVLRQDNSVLWQLFKLYSSYI